MRSGIVPLAAGASRIVLVRHGEPDDTVQGRCYGRLDPGLSSRGCGQMRRTWRLLDGERVTAIYSSPMRRAAESTALRPSGGPPVRIDARLREIDFGALEGLSYDEVASRFPDIYAAWMARPTGVVFPDGESFAAMAARVGEALDQFRIVHRGETIVIVSHGGVNRIALAAALELDPCRIFRFDQAYACVNVIDYVGDEPVVRVVNAVSPERC